MTITTKLFEVRDRGTCMVVMATRVINTPPLSGDRLKKYKMLSHVGYGNYPVVILTRLDTSASKNDPYEWRDRTLLNAHLFIQANFETLADTALVDVEYLLEETVICKKSEF